MRFARWIIAGFAAVSTTTLFACLDIQTSGAPGERRYYIIDNGSPHRAIGLLWDEKARESEYGYFAENDVAPEFFWSPDHAYLAVNGGSAHDRQLFIYRASKRDIDAVTIQPMTKRQMAAIEKLRGNIVADGIEAVGWTADRSLELRVWASSLDPLHSDSAPVDLSANLEVDALLAKVTSVSERKPEAGDENGESRSVPIDATSLEGEYPCWGVDPADGGSYQGTARITATGSTVTMEWNRGGQISQGRGLLVGTALGVSRDGGLALYQIIPQAEGKMLVGVWSSEHSERAGAETIRIGSPDQSGSRLPAAGINGNYVGTLQGQPGVKIAVRVAVTGDDSLKSVRVTTDGTVVQGRGLLLADSFATAVSGGVGVFHVEGEGRDLRLDGRFIDRAGNTRPASLAREE
ncbi:hypothetical protein TSACC_3133 [Terrimicrobium sacchariphilum]|uniref:Uncharacterized protein n=1 Tax=Terrimicrobium sacchariphilum TaxID=690879 RepID=A0A146GD47_TERSA|nr:hypothetical protein [Terrimicrobium sacchariphilum]GAT35072.1 hypothetical protein TSACC_3133 [Terrimicrobium sacchariphilum]